MPPSLNHQAALRYAKAGFPVFPLKPNGKEPITKHGCKDATTDQGQVDAWWSKSPNANIGFACGHNGDGLGAVVVVDIDTDEEKSINGFESLAGLGAMPPTLYADTPRGGRHYYFRASASNLPKNANGLRVGIDIRGLGYYVVLPPSRHPNGGYYKWGEGCNPFSTLLAEYPDFMRVGSLRTGRPSLPAAEVVSSGEGLTQFDPRTIAYAETIEPAAEGQAGHEKLLWFFQCCINGMRMSVSEAQDFGWRFYNPRCVPPWRPEVPQEYKEFMRKANEAKAKPITTHPIGWIVEDPEFNIPQADPDFDYDAFLEAGKKPAEPEATDQGVPNHYSIEFWRKKADQHRGEGAEQPDAELQFLCRPHGLLGDVCSFINRRSKYPQPFLSVAAGLAFLGSVFGHKVCDDHNGRTNIYTFGIGPSSSGKQNALTSIRSLAFASNYFDMIGGDEVTSDAAIESVVYEHPCTTFIRDEVGFVLKAAKSGSEHKAGVIPMLMKLYSLSGDIYKGKSYADSDRQRVIVQPCVSFYATSTDERFREGVSVEELEDGWIARALMFSADQDPQFREPDLLAPPSEYLLKALEFWKKLKGPEMDTQKGFSNYADMPPGSKGDSIPAPFVFETVAAARREFERLRKFARGYGGDYRTLWLKAEEIARRVALIMAAGRSFDDRRIEKIDAVFACRLVSYCISDFANKIAPSVGNDKDYKNLVRTKRLIKEAGRDGIKRYNLMRKCQRWRRDAEGIVKSLLESNDIFVIDVPSSNGKRCRVYWDKEFHKEASQACKKQ